MDKKKNDSQLGALWKNPTSGYITGRLEKETVLKAIEESTEDTIAIGIFENTFKEKPTQPDFHVLVLKKKDAGPKKRSFPQQSKKSSIFD